MIFICIFFYYEYLLLTILLELRHVDLKSREQGHRQKHPHQKEERPLSFEIRKKGLQMHEMQKFLSRIKLR